MRRLMCLMGAGLLLPAAGAGCCLCNPELSSAGYTITYTKPPTTIAPALVNAMPGAYALAPLGTVAGGTIGGVTATSCGPAPAPGLRMTMPSVETYEAQAGACGQANGALPMPRAMPRGPAGAPSPDPCQTLQDVCRRLDRILSRMEKADKVTE